MEVVEGRAEIDDLDAFLDDLGEIGEEFDCAMQAFDPDYVVGESHLRAAVERADRAFDRGENVARERAVEILLYAAGRRQIDRALRMGVSEGDDSAVIVVVHSPAGDESAEAAAAAAVEDLFAPASADADAGASEISDEEADAGASATGDEETDAGASATDEEDASADAGTDKPSSAGASADESALAPDRIDRQAVLAFFDVSEAELSATDADLSDLVRERVALLDVEK